MPYLEIDLKKIQHNARSLKRTCDLKNISIIGVTKVTLGNPSIAKILIQEGIKYIGDSRVQNIIKMQKAGVNAQFILIRNPAISEIPIVVKYTDISLNSELYIIEKLSEESLLQKKKHGVILMVEMGDLREGIMPKDLENIIDRVLKLKGVELKGLGTNLKCFAGVIPDEKNMKEFSEIAKQIQNKFGIKFKFISGGNSANYDWLITANDIGSINNLRIGTAILLGVGGINENPIPELYNDAFTFVAEIIELKKKPLFPKGTITTNAFGEPSIFMNKNKFKNVNGTRNQALLNAGRQDIQETGLKPRENVEIMSASSDYIIVDIKNSNLKIGDKLLFDVNYEALLSAMTSPFVSKVFI
jgi:predicted amino acid racemase